MSDLVCLGKIVAAHGIRGEVKIKSFTSTPKDECAYGRLSNKDETRYFDLTFKGFAKELLRVKINGVDTRNDAESIIGTELYVLRDKLPALEPDTFYLADLEGLKVLDNATGEDIGRIIGIYNFGAGDILEIKFDGQTEPQMLPFSNTYVPMVDIKNGFVKVAQKELNYQKDEVDNA